MTPETESFLSSICQVVIRLNDSFRGRKWGAFVDFTLVVTNFNVHPNFPDFNLGLIF